MEKTPESAVSAHGSGSDVNADNKSIGNIITMEWPTDILLHFLQALDAECDSGAQRAWHQLAFLTCKQHSELCRLAKIMPRPILLRIEIVSATEPVFRIPFMQASAVCVDVDWGDGCVDQLREKGAGFAEHTYSTLGKYAVRISPRGEGSNSLDHLGFSHSGPTGRGIRTAEWWRPLREIVSLGQCGLRSLSCLFSNCLDFRAPLEQLRFPGVTDLSGMFYKSNFNQPIGGWDVSNVTNMNQMFALAAQFNQPIGDWNVGKVTDMSGMFQLACVFNQPISNWNVSNVAIMAAMFCGPSVFNQPLNGWDVSKVTNMSFMFNLTSHFNQPLGDWNVGNVTNMRRMFAQASAFNQPIGDWNVSNVTDMSYMFYNASPFNQTIGAWNVSNVTNTAYMFCGASAFKQDISGWNLTKVGDNKINMFNRAPTL
jgi:surface protein